MASDNTIILDPVATESAEGGDVIATDDITDGGVAEGVKVQRVKTGYGKDGEYADVTADVPLPTIDAVLKALLVHNQEMAFAVEHLAVQIKITNFQLALLTGQKITEDDIQFGD